jgi:hypothetical protein
MADVTSSITATPKLGIRVSDAVLSPVPPVEPSISSVRPDTGSPSANGNSSPSTVRSEAEQLASDDIQTRVSQIKYLAKIPMTACRVFTPHERIRFGIRVSAFEKKTGVKLEKRRIYQIKGTIADICAFEKRHFEGSTVVVMVPPAYMGVVIPGRKYEIRIVSIEDRRQFTVHREAEENSVIVIRRLDLRALGIPAVKKGKGVLELMLRKANGFSNPTKRVFANIQSGNGFVRFDASNVDGKPGDIFELLSARSYKPRDFVREFNSVRPPEARNATLTMNRGRVGIKVEGKKFIFERCNLSRIKSRLLLRTKLSFYDMELRFWFNGQSFEIRFGVYPVAAIRLWHGMKIKFERPVDKRAMAEQRELYSEVQKKGNPIWHKFKTCLGSLRLASIPKEITGVYKFEVDAAMCRFVCSKFAKTTKNEYSTRKGSFGEIIAAHILSIRYPDTREHPSVKFPKALGCHKQGVDYEIPNGRQQESDLIEVKWWKNVRAAINEGRIQVRKRLVENQSSISPAPLRRAFVAAVDWDPNSRSGRLIIAEAKFLRHGVVGPHHLPNLDSDFLDLMGL